MHGAILGKFLQLNETKGFLGFPISDEEVVYGKNKKPTSGRISRFQGGTIYWSSGSGAHEVHGDIRRLYEEVGGPMSELGYPITSETRRSGSDIRFNDFQKGIIVWRPGMGAKVITSLRLHIGMVKSGKIDDGIGFFKKDKTAELITKLLVKVNGQTVHSQKRRPGGHGGTSRHVNYTRTIKPVRSTTSIYFKVRAEDWDAASGNDYLGKIEKTYTIVSLWGFNGGSPPGVYYGASLTSKGGDSPKKSTIKTDYSILNINKNEKKV